MTDEQRHHVEWFQRYFVDPVYVEPSYAIVGDNAYPADGGDSIPVVRLVHGDLAIVKSKRFDHRNDPPRLARFTCWDEPAVDDDPYTYWAFLGTDITGEIRGYEIVQLVELTERKVPA